MAIPLSALRVGPIPIVKFLVDDILVNKRQDKLIWIPIATVTLYVLNLVVRFLHYYSVRIVVVNVNQKIREKIFDKLINLSADHFTERKAGELLSRITADPHHLDNGIASLNILLREPITFIGLLGYTLYVNWKLTLLTFTIVPALAYVFLRMGKMVKIKISDYQQQNAESYSTVQESIAGFRIVQLFNLQNYMSEKFKTQLSGITVLLLKISKMEELTSPMVELVTSFAVALILYYGGLSVLRGEMTSGDLIAFFTAFGVMINPIRQLSDINTKMYSAAAAMDRINEFLGWENKIKESPEAIPTPAKIDSIAFDRVTFAYPDTPDHKVIQDLTFEIPSGKTVALVGQSGSGKSSIVQLLTRLYDVQTGAININGIDVRRLKVFDWRSHVAVVSQDVFLFHDTIMNNLKMGNPDATAEEVVEAARKAFAYDFIMRLPKGFETIVGDRGMKLSGGERQRISIARAFLKNAQFLILDEATSNLDNESEKIVQQTLEQLMRNRTTLVIAHRLSTIQNADQIIVLREGKMIESGQYGTLVSSGGEFSNLVSLSKL
ncbi:MAG: ABC transporter ATP-binding protein [Bdellovibrionales bacterium]|nr:ABC transporter ATP-binding protein [Bdellovibrionales bacterium]